MRYALGDYAETSYGPEGKIIAYTDQPTYVLETPSGGRVSVIEHTIKAVRKPEPLPTTPGYYVGDYRESPSGKILIELLNSPKGQWVDNTDSRYLEESWVRDLENLTRLVPASDD